MRPVDALVQFPVGEKRVTRATVPINADKSGRDEMIEGRIDVSRRHLGMKRPQERAELLGVGDEPPLVIGLADHADPEAVLPISERPHLAVLAVLGLQRADSGHRAPFRALQRVHVTRRFSSVFRPPASTGTMWSSSKVLTGFGQPSSGPPHPQRTQR